MGTTTLHNSSDVSAPADPNGSNRMSDELRGLVDRAVDRDGDAFAALYEEFRPKVWRYIYYRINSSTLADDLTQETFLRALKRIGSFEPRQHIGAWFNTIARNLIIDHLRSGWHTRTMLKWTPADDALPDLPEHDPAAVAISTDVGVALWALVASLPSEDQRRVIQLRFWADLSIREVSEEMEKEEGAIKALQARAVRTLGRMPEVWALWDRLVPSEPPPSTHSVARILTLLREQRRPWGATEVAARLAITTGLAQGVMRVLAEFGQLERDASGRYALPVSEDDVQRRLSAAARSEPGPDTDAGKVLALVRSQVGTWRSRDVATTLHITAQTASEVLRALAELELLVSLGRGIYALP
jgi:RNA polymerase sigma-70 factor (ECF subfamily)